MKTKTQKAYRFYQEDVDRWQEQADKETNGNLTHWIESQLNNSITLQEINAQLESILFILKSKN